ncbi:hypothetical protein FHG87_011470 [Trinorchestia longiramus]|nr:hypothetical protein FHG87_011470 [Trinorchestia longiramus]
MSMAACILSTSTQQLEVFTYGSFLLLEVSVGMYLPSIGYLRSQVIPEELRASIMNWFRVPMNILTCSGLLLLHNNTLISTTESMFAICTVLLAVATFASLRFSKLFSAVSVAASLVAFNSEKQPLNIAGAADDEDTDYGFAIVNGRRENSPTSLKATGQT